MKKTANARFLMAIIMLSCSGTMLAQGPSGVGIAADTVSPNTAKNVIIRPGSSTVVRNRWHSLIVPAGLITYGFVTLQSPGLRQLDHSTGSEIREDHPSFKTPIDNYLQYSPAAAVYVLNIAGVKGRHNFRDRTIIYGLSTVFSAAMALPLKNITHIERPDHSGFNSFPSGHTTTAFAAAEFLREEYRDVSPWYGIAGYAAAAATGVLRLYNNKHWVSDVVAGAGFGMLSTKLAYWIYPVVQRKLFKEKPVTTLVLPYYQSGGGGLAVVYHFR